MAVKTIHGLDSTDLPLPRSVLTVGNFDGVHRGHLQIIAQVKALGGEVAGPCVVLTFEPHPLSVVNPGNAPARLTTEEDKIRCLALAGVDITVVAEASRALLALSPEEFVEQIVGRFHPTHIVEGPTFGFGRGRSGTVKTLSALGPGHGFEVCVVESVKVRFDDGEPIAVSSSLIRKLVAEGRVERASLALGRRYALSGEIVPGTRRGAELGFPTANLAVSGQLIPADGVYAGSAWLGDEPAGQDRPCPAAISVGRSPTFQRGGHRLDRKIEAHLLDKDLDLYGCRMRLEFGAWLRPQRTFESPEALGNQISQDVESVRRYLAERIAGREPLAESS